MKENKDYPAELENAVLKSLSFYPELKNVRIQFKYVSRIKKSVMLAQPRIKTIFNRKKNRSYVIKMSKTFRIDGFSSEISKIPFEVQVGWLGHELGHIMDYLDRSVFSLAAFGIGYLFSANYVKGAERTADEFAVQHGMGDFIVATKNYILNHTHFSEKYKSKIRKLYLSSEEIVKLVQTHKLSKSLIR